jgi:hypothetical protein
MAPEPGASRLPVRRSVRQERARRRALKARRALHSARVADLCLISPVFLSCMGANVRGARWHQNRGMGGPAHERTDAPQKEHRQRR